MKKQEIKVYTVLTIDKNSVVALGSYTNKEEANAHAKSSAEQWKGWGREVYQHSFNGRGLISSKYICDGKEVAEYKVVETQLFI